MTPAFRYIPADDLIRGWMGPIEWQGAPDGPWRRGVWGPLGSSSETPTWGIVTSPDGHDREYPKRLDTHRPEVVSRLARWLADRGHSATHLLPRWLGGQLDDATAGEALAWSVLSVRAGGGVMATILREWATWADGRATRRILVTGTTDNPWPTVSPTGGWHVGGRFGHQTGDTGRACADAAALGAGLALLSPDGTVTWPPLPTPEPT